LAQLQRLVLAPTQIVHPQINLTAEQQHYLVRVLRLRSGDRFIAMNGQGESWLAELTTTSAMLLETINVTAELPLAVTLALALPKSNGFDDVVRQVTELGVDRIVPIISDRTLMNPSLPKRDRWRRIAQEAAEQSERQIVPVIFDPIAFSDYLSIDEAADQSANDATSLRLICVTRNQPPHLLERLTNPLTLSRVTLAIGPEGGWTEGEIERAIAAGYQPVSLGQRILRAVTAPLAALAMIAGAVRA
jgi:16S rRNA (uracil1498-N3)-methyltransferase